MLVAITLQLPQARLSSLALLSSSSPGKLSSSFSSTHNPLFRRIKYQEKIACQIFYKESWKTLFLYKLSQINVNTYKLDSYQFVSICVSTEACPLFRSRNDKRSLAKYFIKMRIDWIS
jgi:hypothetical protein